MEEDTSADLGSLEDNGDKVTSLYKKTRKALPITKKSAEAKEAETQPTKQQEKVGSGLGLFVWGFGLRVEGLRLRVSG